MVFPFQVHGGLPAGGVPQVSSKGLEIRPINAFPCRRIGKKEAFRKEGLEDKTQR